MSERSDLLSASSAHRSEATVLKQAQIPDQLKSSKTGNKLSVKSSQRKVASSAAYLHSGSSKK